MATLAAAICTLIGLISAAAKDAQPPVIPIGLDACRQWGRWPYQRIGMRA